MLESTRAVRVAATLVAVVALVVAFGIRALAGGHLYSDGALQQNSGTALYASAVYAGVVFLRPGIGPLVAGAWAAGFCWAVEFFQLTGVPHTMSRYSIILRLIFGDAFDWNDVAWYPAGVVPLVALHWLVRARGTRGANTAARQQ